MANEMQTRQVWKADVLVSETSEALSDEEQQEKNDLQTLVDFLQLKTPTIAEASEVLKLLIRKEMGL